MSKTTFTAYFVIILGVALMLVIPILRITDHFYINYNEGWNAYHALLAWKVNLYGNHFIPVNYPPLSFYLLGLFPNPLFAGRFMSLFALCINCFFVSLLVYKSTKNRIAAFTSGMLAFSIFLGLAQYYVGMDDPQLLAQAIMLFGGFLYYYRKNIIVVALCIAISLFVKQNLLAIPLAISLDLFWRNKRELLKYLTSLILFGVTLLIVSQIISHGQFLSSILVKRELTITNVLKILKISILPIFPICILSTFYKKKDFFFYYVISSLIIGLFFSIGYGVDVNINFDVFLSISIVIGLLLAENRKIIFIILFQFILLFGVRVYQHNVYYSVSDRESAALKTISIIKNTKGNILCEDIELCYFSGKPFIYDPYLINEEIKVGTVKENKIVNLIKQKHFSLVEIHTPLQKEQGKFTPNFMIALQDNYSFKNGMYYPKDSK